MKKTVCFIMVFVLMFVMTACGNSPTEDASSKPQDATGEPIGETAFIGNTFIINGAECEVADYYGIEDAFVLELYENGYDNMLIYDVDDLTTDILENRTQSDNIIIERCIGIVTNKEQAGDGIILNTAAEYNYISYRSVDFEIHNGTIVLTYFIYNPGTDYADDIMCRYDFLLDRQYKD